MDEDMLMKITGGTCNDARFLFDTKQHMSSAGRGRTWEAACATVDLQGDEPNHEGAAALTTTPPIKRHAHAGHQSPGFRGERGTDASRYDALRPRIIKMDRQTQAR
jgi:hypothetical protein